MRPDKDYIVVQKENKFYKNNPESPTGEWVDDIYLATRYPMDKNIVLAEGEKCVPIKVREIIYLVMEKQNDN